MSISIPLITPKSVINSYVYLNESDVIFSHFKTDSLLTLTSNNGNIGKAGDESAFSTTATPTDSNSGYYNLVRNEMLYSGKINSTSAFTTDIGLLIFNKKYFDSKIIEGSFTATSTGDLAGIYYDNGNGDIIEEISGNTIGNIFYDLGLISLTGTGFKQVACSITAASYKACVLNTNISVYCKCNPDQLNYSYNSTAFDLDSINYTYLNSNITANTNNAIYRSDLVASGISWQPTITSLGLYDDDNNLLAVAKVSKPIRKSTDIPTTFAFSIDI